VQLYVGEQASRLLRPQKELRHFAKVQLEPGQSRAVHFELRARDFSYYDVRLHDWVIDSGNFTILVGGSSRGPLLTESIAIEVERPYPPLTRDSMLKEFREHPRARAGYRQLLDSLIAVFSGAASAATETPDQRKAREMAEAFWSELPIWKLPLMSQGQFTEAQVEALLAQVR
jgi:beta-glucosidase